MKSWSYHVPLSLLCLIVSLIQLGCNRYDELDQRVKVLEDRFEQINADIIILQQIVSALQNKIYVVEVTETEAGYNLLLSDNSTLQIRNGRDGADGKDGDTPIIGVKQSDDDIYYWTVYTGGIETWLTDGDGNKIPVAGSDGKNGITPLLCVDNDGYWMVSYDNGVIYEYIYDSDGVRIMSKGSIGDSYFLSVAEDADFVYLTLHDGSVIQLPKQVKLAIVFDIAEDLAVFPGSSVDVAYTVEGESDSAIVKAFGQNGWTARAIPSGNAKGIIRITAPKVIVEDEIIVLVYDGTSTTIMSTINCVEGIIETMDDYIDMPVEGGNRTISLKTNMDYNIVIPKAASAWISISGQDTKAMRTDEITLSFTKNPDILRYTTIELQDEAGQILRQIGISQQGARTDYAALVSFYNALGGNGWLHNDNWCSDEDIEKWYGVTFENGRVVALSLGANNLTGNIPVSVGDLAELRELNLYFNGIEGGLPQSMAQLSELKTFNCRYNRMNVDDILPDIVSNPHFQTWKLFPQSDPDRSETFDALMTFYESTDGDNWICNEGWGTDLPFDNWYGIELDLSGKISKIALDTNNLCGFIPEALGKMTTLKSLLLYHNDLEGTIPESVARLPHLATLFLQRNNLSGQIPESLLHAPQLHTLSLHSNCFETTSFKVQENKINQVSTLFNVFPQKNESFRFFIDSDADGNSAVHPDCSYEIYQSATKGPGLDLFIICEGFDADENTIGGTAEYWMKRAADAAFKIAPMNKLKEYYNVYIIYAHSRERGVSLGNNMIDSKFGYHQPKLTESTATIDKEKCIKFIQESTGRDMDNSSVIVVVNSTHNNMPGGINLLNSVPQTSFSLIPVYASKYSALVWHEAIGHGIGYLGDEYGANKAIYNHALDSQIAKNANLDVEPDPQKVKWSAFIEDDRYADECIGVYEGGKGYDNGVYRPTETSIMRATQEVLKFNAPSRASIYENTMKLVFQGWTFDYEEFVAFDNSCFE